MYWNKRKKTSYQLKDLCVYMDEPVIYILAMLKEYLAEMAETSGISINFDICFAFEKPEGYI